MVDLRRFDAQFFKTCTTLEQAQAYVRTLPWDQRLQIWRVPVSEWRFAKKLSPSNPLYRLRRTESYLSLSDAVPPPSQKQVCKLAVTIYRIVKQAKRLAKREGKPLRILAGELHTCPEGNLATNILTLVAARLGIEVIAVEGGEDKVEPYPNFADHLQEANESYNRHVFPSETDERSAMPERQRQSQAFQVLAALEAGYRLDDIVDCDPLRETGTHAERHKKSAEILKEIAESGKGCLSMQGAMHASALEPEMATDASAHTLVFNTSHTLYNWSIGTNSEHLADAVILDGQNLKELATGNKIIQIVVPGGQIRSVHEAFALSRGARKALSTRSLLVAAFAELLTTGIGAGAVSSNATRGSALRDSIVGAAAVIRVRKIASYARTRQAKRMHRNDAPVHSPGARRHR
jgi:hypothetical protein